ncbi:hypothetical protein GCM10010332_73750 [Streptomyces albogriseolus]|nr:hypothetical protein GCM10010332_73750 [Streptomyces albogriseolus]
MWGRPVVVGAYRCGRDGWALKVRTAEPERDGEEQPDELAVEAQVPAGAPPVSPAESVSAIGTPHAQL